MKQNPNPTRKVSKQTNSTDATKKQNEMSEFETSIKISCKTAGIIPVQIVKSSVSIKLFQEIVACHS